MCASTQQIYRCERQYANIQFWQIYAKSSHKPRSGKRERGAGEGKERGGGAEIDEKGRGFKNYKFKGRRQEEGRKRGQGE